MSATLNHRVLSDVTDFPEASFSFLECNLGPSLSLTLTLSPVMILSVCPDGHIRASQGEVLGLIFGLPLAILPE